MAVKQIDYYGQFTPTGVDMSTAKRFQALAGLADRANELAFNVAAKKRQEQGIKAGQLAGIEAAETGTPVKPKEGLLASFSIFDQAYNGAMEKAYVASIDMDAREEISRIAGENPDNLEAFNKLATEYAAGVMGSVSEEYAPTVQMSIESVLSNARMQVQQNEIAKNVKAADETLVRQIDLSLRESLRLANMGNIEAAQEARMAAFAGLDARVESGQMTEAGAANKKQEIMIATESEVARGGLQTIIREKGVIQAADYIDKLQEMTVPGFSVDEQDALIDTLRSDLSQHIQLENIKDAQAEEDLKINQSANASDLFIGLINGTVDAADITLAGMNRSVNFSQLTQLTNVLNSRGQGVDDYALITDIQTTMRTDPAKAQEMIRINTGSRISTSTASQLYSAATDSELDESPLKTSKANRFRTFLEKNVVVVGPMGAVDFDSQERLAKLKLVYDERILAGEDPAVVANDLVDINDVIVNPIDNPQQALEDLDKQLGDGLITDSEYDSEYARIQSYKQRKANADAFQRALEQALRGNQ